MTERVLNLRSRGRKTHFWHFFMGEFMPLVAAVARQEPSLVRLSTHRSPFLRFYDEISSDAMRIELVTAEEGDDFTELPRWDFVDFQNVQSRRFSAAELQTAIGWLVDWATGAIPLRADRVVFQLRAHHEDLTRFYGRGSYGSRRRSITNLAEVSKQLAQRFPDEQVTNCSTEGMTLKAQILAHVAARVLVLGHGAGMAHVLWLRPGSLVVEIIPTGKRDNAMGPILADRLGLEYRRIWVDGNHAEVDAEEVIRLTAPWLGAPLDPARPADGGSPGPAAAEQGADPRALGVFDSVSLAAWANIEPPERVALNRARLDDLALDWEELRGRESKRIRRARRKVVFFHLPKTGGSSFESILAANQAVGRTFRVRENRLEQERDLLGLLVDQFRGRRGNVAVSGHFRMSGPVYQTMKTPFVNVTILRQPVHLVISFYNFMQRDPRLRRARRRAGHLSLEEFVETEAMDEIANVQVRRLSGFNRVEDGSERAALVAAKENLESRFSLFGLTERFDELLIMCHRLLRWDDILHRPRNVAPAEEPRDPPAATLELIREYNQLDSELYAFAAALFAERCEQLQISDDDVARLRDANASFAAISTQNW